MDIIEQLFVVNRQLQGLKANYADQFVSEDENVKHNDNAKVLSQQSLVDAILFPHHSRSKNILQQANHRPVVFTRYKEALTTLAHMQSDTQVAASTHEKLKTRHGEGFTLVISEDPTSSEQVYLVMSWHNVTGKITALPVYLYAEYNDAFYVLAFATGSELANKTMRFQTLIERNSIEYSAVTDPQSRLYLL